MESADLAGNLKTSKSNKDGKKVNIWYFSMHSIDLWIALKRLW